MATLNLIGGINDFRGYDLGEISDVFFDPLAYSSLLLNTDQFGEDQVSFSLGLHGTAEQNLIWLFMTTPGTSFSAENFAFSGWDPSSDAVAISGSTGDDNVIGSLMRDEFQPNGGRDTFFGGGGDDYVSITTAVAAGSVFDGGSHTSGDSISIQNLDLDLTASYIISIEELVLLGNSTITLDDDHVGLGAITRIQTFDAGQTLIVSGADIDLAGVVFTGTLGTVTLAGTPGNDSILGSHRGESLFGGLGNDLLDGRGGNDLMNGGAGNDTYYVDHPADQVIEGVGRGIDTVYASSNWVLGAGQEVENLAIAGGTAGTLKVYLTGNAFNQTLFGNNAVNLLDGAGGADIMRGYGGNDTYYVDHAGDQVIEAVGGGTDRVFASANHVLGAGQEVEILQTLGVSTTANINLTGNAFAQTLYGNAGRNILNGGAGNDVLWGFGGNDTFLFNTALSAATNVDTITDFSVPHDTIALENAVFTSLAATGVLNPAFLRIGAAAQDANDHIIYNSATGALLYDADGSGAGAAVRFAQLAAGLALTNADFLVV